MLTSTFAALALTLAGLGLYGLVAWSLAQRTQPSAETWCVFDNSASGAALENAWELHHLLLPGAVSDVGRFGWWLRCQ